ncbi:MAG: 4-hydroxy-tetrahydrodipicolinate reductase [Candidatus Caenarcaniphilales bacterium]|nr:4-hydroxy-tetrahydrodipicolinate reductase [Candidatus Caenarcaniphilales bacterium]
MSKTNKIKVVVAGAAGRMGQETVRAILREGDLELVGVAGRRGSELIGQDIGEIISKRAIGVPLQDNLKDLLDRTKPDVMIDFTVPGTVFMNAQIALEAGARPIVGATGLSEEDLRELEKKAKFCDSAVLIAPNFALGALLMIECAKKIARYFEQVEIIELHHEKKVDAPSGTSIKTAHALASVRDFKHQELSPDSPARGSKQHGIRIHSLRLPGLLAHQEVIFGSTGQTLSLRHDTLDRTAFMPGVVMATRKIMERKGLVYGLENLLEL